MLREGEVDKRYLAVVKGRWSGPAEIREALHKYVTASGERRVSVKEGGMQAVTKVSLKKSSDDFSVLDLRLMTGRTHQIRVHLAHAGHPVLGDDKYGDFELNRKMAKQGVRRLFLHAERLSFRHPLSGAALALRSSLPKDMKSFIDGHLR